MSEPPPFSPTIMLLTVSRVWEAALADALKPLGLTIRKYGMLGHIRGTPTSRSVSWPDARASRCRVRTPR